MNRRLTVLVISAAFLCAAPAFGQALVADHFSVNEFPLIPLSIVEAIETDYSIYYVHTSHGSQIMTGLEMVHDKNGSYDRPYFYEVGDDLGGYGDTTWAPATRTYLNTHPQCNMAMFSWCGGVSDNTEEGINIYLAKMEELEVAYPNVRFIYMTGHLDGSGPDGNLYLRNDQIRAYCSAHGKILFDFADIESYDPDGVWYPDETDACYWCDTWCSAHTCPTCGGCAHSHCFNCYLKGKAWWWMMARLEGWSPGPCDCPDFCDLNTDGIINPTDVVIIANFVYRGIDTRQPLPSCPRGNGDWNCDGGVSPTDVVVYVNAVYKSSGEIPCDPCGP